MVLEISIKFALEFVAMEFFAFYFLGVLLSYVAKVRDGMGSWV